MEETKKSRNDQGGNGRIVIKIGGGGGGVIGAVVLLGGALATAAFVLGQKRWSSAAENSSPEIDEKSEESHEQISEGDEEEEVELEEDSAVVISAHSLKADVEAISDDGFVIVNSSPEIPLLAEKEEKESTNVVEGDEIDGEEDINGVEGDEIDDKNVDIEVMMKKKDEFAVLCNGNGEINEEKSVNGCVVSNDEAEAEEEGAISSGDVEIVKHVENENGDEQEVVVRSFDRKGEYSSKWESLWQAEWTAVAPQRVKLAGYEARGKVREDKYEAACDDREENSTRLRVAVWALSVAWSLSCSWLLDLSCAKLCLVAFLTVFLLEIYGYPLLGRRRPRKGESGFEARH